MSRSPEITQQVIKALSKMPLRCATEGPTLPECPPQCGDRAGLTLDNRLIGWVPEDFNEDTGLSRTHRNVKCPHCELYTVWVKR
jgi:hypothetical protein